MINRRATRMPKVAKYAILAMLLADGLGIYLAHNKINRPVPDSAEEAIFALADPAQQDAGEGLELTRSKPGLALTSAALPRRAEALPAMLELKPIAPESADDNLSAARIEQRAERAAEIPVTRVASRRLSRRQARLFTNAFARDIPTPVADFAPDISLAKLPEESDAGQQSAGAYEANRIDAVPTSAERNEAPVAEVPVGDAQAVASGGDSQPAPPLPVPSFGPAAELPPS